MSVSFRWFLPEPRAPSPAYNFAVAIGTAFHARTLPLAGTLSFRDWAGFFAASAYEAHHEHEYNAIRNGCALIDISPLFKYRLHGPDALRLVDRVITRDASAMQVGQVVYTPWCDDDGKVIDDGTVARLADDRFRWTAADPNLRWLTQHAAGLRVEVEDVSERVAALALQGPTSARLLAAVSDAADRLAQVLPRRRRDPRRRAGRGHPHRLHRRSRLRAVDAVGSRRRGLGRAGRGWPRACDLRPAGMLALDVARVEAGLLLTDVDFHSSRKASIDAQMYTPAELGLGRLVALDKAAPFVGREALRRERAAGHRRQIVGLEVRLERRRGDLRADRAAAHRAGRRVAGGGARVPRSPAGGEGDDHRLVAHPEATDRPGDDRPAALRRGHGAAVRDHRRGDALHGGGHGGADAVPEPGPAHGVAEFVTGSDPILCGTRIVAEPAPLSDVTVTEPVTKRLRRGLAGRLGTT